jgi:hypothetical protein
VSDKPKPPPPPNLTDNAASVGPPPAKLSIERIRDYRITEEIGSGGMAVVYKGIQESLGRVVAIKALKTSMSTDDNVVTRFRREALTVASLQHENLINLYDFFHERGALFMVMEYVEGIDLYDLVERCPQFPHDAAAIIALQVAHALDYAHFRGVVHRDVKPANIMISKLGEVKLTDFGIARVQESDLTQTGMGLGTPSYMSPEQIVGDPIDHRSDIWSLGVVCYQMLAGHKPFVDSEQRSALQKIRLDQPTPIRRLNPNCPRELENILFRCIRKAPQDRYGSAQELVVALEHYLATRVNTNYRARLVTFLREHAVITADETSAMLHPALIGDTSVPGTGARRTHERSRGVRAWLLALFALAVGTAGGWIAAQRLPVELVRADRQATAPSLIASRPESVPPGYLQVLAHPWAHVRIDGKPRATTPFAAPIELEPGAHTVTLENPYFAPQTHQVEIRKRKTSVLTAALKRPTQGSEPAGTP